MSRDEQENLVRTMLANDPVENQKLMTQVLGKIRALDMKGQPSGRIDCPVCRELGLDYNVNANGAVWVKCQKCEFSSIDKID